MRFLFWRFVRLAATLLAVTTIVFVLLHASGDPVRSMLPPEADQRQVEALRRSLGLDKPLPVQYFRFLERAAHGDFGVSLVHRQPAVVLVRERIVASLKLLAGAALVMLFVAIPLGILAATNRGRPIDTLAMLFAISGQSMPAMWLGLVLIMIFSVNLGWFPTGGGGELRALVLPSVTLGAVSAGIITRLTRSSMLDVLGVDYVRTARAKGLHERIVILKHALKNAAVPVVTVFGYQVPLLFSGALITEQVFSYPGIGRLLVTSVGLRDIPVVLAAVVTIGFLVVVSNLLVDVIHTLIDPRVRVG